MHLVGVCPQVAAEGDEEEVAREVVLPEAPAAGGVPRKAALRCCGGPFGGPRLGRLLALQDVLPQVTCES